MSEPTITATEELWHTADKSRLVPKGDPEAAHLFCEKGEVIRAEWAAKFGLTDSDKKKKK
jgi:hypothetical protein